MAEQSAWTWRHAILKSDLPPTTRHLLITISCYMNDVGEGCYPSVATLTRSTGLTKRAIITHIARAVTEGWLKVEKHGFTGQQWKRNEYKALWPKGGEPNTPRSEKVVNDVPKGGEPNDQKVVNDVHLILPSTLPEILPSKTPPAKNGGVLLPKEEVTALLGDLARSLKSKYDA